MRVLFVHQAFLAQLRQLGLSLAADPANDVRAICHRSHLELGAKIAPRIRAIGFENPPDPRAYYPAAPSSSFIEWKLARGRGAERCAEQLRAAGYVPDVIVAHPGWGDATYLKDVFPESKLLLYCESFAFMPTLADPEYSPVRPEEVAAFNLPMHAALAAYDRGISPTHWQRSQFPAEHHRRIEVIHDGIDSDAITPGVPEDDLVTYVSRGLEPARGFHHFMRAIPIIQRRRPSARFMIVGSDEVHYSPLLPAGQSYRASLLKELEGSLDLSRVTFAGSLPYDQYLSVIRQSAVHVYLTLPISLSWSLLEAMSAGCFVVGSRTPPVEEVLRDGENGLLVDMFNPQAIADAVLEGLANQRKVLPLREEARRTVEIRYDLKRVCLPRQLNLIETLLS